ncbi:MAG: hypothetical protein JSS49_00815 [Planctomycetes bacterium]|nr:hypothetical protein [Planctomycetota bacterium]
MKVRQSFGKWFCAALCLSPVVSSIAAGGFADETDSKPPSSQTEAPARQVEVVIDSAIPTSVGDGVQTFHVRSVGGVSGGAVVYTDPGPQDKFWIGLLCTEPGEALRTQLDLADGEGLLVEEVSDGPGKRAGFQRHDLLLKAMLPSKSGADAHRLSSPQDLVKVVQAAETKALKLEFLRRGKKQVLEVTPEERPNTAGLDLAISRLPYQVGNVKGTVTGIPGEGVTFWAGPMIMNVAAVPLPPGMTMEFQPAEGPPETVTVKQGDRTWEAEVKSIDKLPEEISALVRQQLELRRGIASRTNAVFTRTLTAGAPSLVIHGSARALPNDVTVTVIRKGADPARISIKKGDQSWDVTEKELDKLPAEVRPIADTALNPARAHATQFVPNQYVSKAGGPATIFSRAKAITLPGPPAIPGTTVTPPVSHQAEIERQLKDLTEQVEKLRQAVEKSQPMQ